MQCSPFITGPNSPGRVKLLRMTAQLLNELPTQDTLERFWPERLRPRYASVVSHPFRRERGMDGAPALSGTTFRPASTFGQRSISDAGSLSYRGWYRRRRPASSPTGLPGADSNTSLAVHFTMKDWPAHNFAHSRIRTAIMTMDWPSGRSNCGPGMLRH